VRNNADLAALAEHTRGAAVGCDNLVYLYGDAGVGGGIIAAGRPVTGHGGYGLEVGPYSGALVADLLLRRPTPLDVGPFAPARFATAYPG